MGYFNKRGIGIGWVVMAIVAIVFDLDGVPMEFLWIPTPHPLITSPDLRI